MSSAKSKLVKVKVKQKESNTLRMVVILDSNSKDLNKVRYYELYTVSFREAVNHILDMFEEEPEINSIRIEMVFPTWTFPIFTLTRKTIERCNTTNHA